MKIDGLGIDFGTTNSVVASSTRGERNPRTRALLTEGRPHPSVVWYRVNEEPVIGRRAKDNIHGFTEAPGNCFVSSVKRTLGRDHEFSIFGDKQPARSVASEIFRHLKADAKVNHGIELSSAVVTIPVEFDGRSRRDLRMAADQAGVHIKGFVHEPFAAIIGYCYSEKSGRTLEDREGEVILVFDWGGGTLDITIGRIEGGTVSELATAGIADRSGDHFDEVLSRFAKTAFMERHLIHPDQFTLLPSTKDRLRTECELRKIDLSDAEAASIALKGFHRTDQRVLDLTESITRDTFNELIQPDVMTAIAKVDEALSQAGLQVNDIDLALMIGGTSRIPFIRKEMHDRFRTRMVQVENADSIIAEGAAIVDALNLHPVLAGPICIELSDGAHYPVFKAGDLVKPELCDRNVALFCTDNRDGRARLIVKQGRNGSNDGFATKGIVSVPVSRDLPKPYNHESVNARFAIDEDLVLRVSARGATQRHGEEVEIFDLRFALKAFGDES